LGPNGAGKTTVISLLVGLLKPDSGSVLIGNSSCAEMGDPTLTAARRLLGVAPQALSIYETMSAQENLDFFGRLYGLSGKKLRDRVNWCLDFAQLQDRAKSYAGTFSGGMKRRLNIAVALIHEPAILLLDEPTVGVDPQSRNHIFESIESLRERGMTILYTTHYMEEAERLCDRVAIVDHGKLLALNSVPHLIDQHGGASMVTGELAEFPQGIDLPGELTGKSIRFASNAPLQDVAALSAQGVAFQTLNIARPNLENVFLTLTGRSLRDG
jgi:ABC-2 type transport system ATP-binding protein